jgi:hypothetical protein
MRATRCPNRPGQPTDPSGPPTSNSKGRASQTDESPPRATVIPPYTLKTRNYGWGKPEGAVYAWSAGAHEVVHDAPHFRIFGTQPWCTMHHLKRNMVHRAPSPPEKVVHNAPPAGVFGRRPPSLHPNPPGRATPPGHLGRKRGPPALTAAQRITPDQTGRRTPHTGLDRHQYTPVQKALRQHTARTPALYKEHPDHNAVESVLKTQDSKLKTQGS